MEKVSSLLPIRPNSDTITIMNHHRTHSADDECVIVFDVMGLYQQFSRDVPAALCGHRYWQVTRPLDAFLRQLTESGVKLVFFMDGPVQQLKIETWTRRQMDAYERICDLSDAMNGGESLANIVRSPIGAYRQLPELFVGEKLCRQYGELIMSVDRECDLELAKYATEHNAIAVVGQVCFGPD